MIVEIIASVWFVFPELVEATGFGFQDFAFKESEAVTTVHDMFDDFDLVDATLRQFVQIGSSCFCIGSFASRYRDCVFLYGFPTLSINFCSLAYNFLDTA
jgi:hypothetical protein